MEEYLFIIPARAGSKGIPGKNIKQLADKPLIQYSIDFARQFTNDEHICLSTNDEAAAQIAKKLNLALPFIRPENISGDTASADEVIKQALNFYESLGKKYKAIVYLQPTSPFRLKKHLLEALSLFETNTADLVVSVCESHLNPYFSLFEENKMGFLERSKQLPAGINRRQDAPKAWQYNGSIFIIRVDALMKSSLHQLERIKKYVMDNIYAIDIDTALDWKYAEFLLEQKLVSFD